MWGQGTGYGVAEWGQCRLQYEIGWSGGLLEEVRDFS